MPMVFPLGATVTAIEPIKGTGRQTTAVKAVLIRTMIPDVARQRRQGVKRKTKQTGALSTAVARRNRPIGAKAPKAAAGKDFAIDPIKKERNRAANDSIQRLQRVRDVLFHPHTMRKEKPEPAEAKCLPVANVVLLEWSVVLGTADHIRVMTSQRDSGTTNRPLREKNMTRTSMPTSSLKAKNPKR